MPTPFAPARPGTLVNDVHSRLNPTHVAEVLSPRCLGDLREAVRRARREERAVSVAGGRHAMGGQQFRRGSLLVDTRGLDRILALDAERRTVTVEAGIRWPELVAGLVAMQEGRSPGLGIVQKQTGADRLSVGGALSSNIHGRGLALRPFVQDVESFVLVDARARVLRVSREENADLFRLAVGGYGLFGLVYSVELRLAPRRKLRRDVELMDARDLASAFERRIADGYLYGDFQFSIDERSPDFLRRGVFSCYRPVPDEAPIPAAQRALREEDWMELLHLAHTDKGEGFRRYAEHYLATDGQVYWSDTHQLGVYLDDYHRRLDERLGARCPASEVITEVYVPPGRLADFLEEARGELRRRRADVIYGTVRRIEADGETFLPWARRASACVVFNLHTEHTPEGVARTAAAFRALIDLALARGGSYFLTYHRWGTRAELLQAYPEMPAFLAAKLAHDPEERFQSEWYRHQRDLVGPRASASSTRG